MIKKWSKPNIKELYNLKTQKMVNNKKLKRTPWKSSFAALCPLFQKMVFLKNCVDRAAYFFLFGREADKIKSKREWIEPLKCRFVTIWERIYTKKTKKTRWKTIDPGPGSDRDLVLRLSVRLSGTAISTLRIGIFSSGFF